MRRLMVALAMLTTLVAPVWGQDPTETKPPIPPPDRPRDRQALTPSATEPPLVADLRTGDKAPDFQLDSSLGGVLRLADLKGHWSVLVFDESRAKMAPLGVVGDSIRAVGVWLYGVCPDGVSALKTLASRERIRFPLLSDLTREVSQSFGMYDRGTLTIQAGIVIVDAKGVIRMVLQGPSLHPDDVLRMVSHVVRGT